MGFRPTFSVGERPQTYAFDRAASGTGCKNHIPHTNTKDKQISGTPYNLEIEGFLVMLSKV